MATRPLYAIAQEVRSDWTKPYFGAVPYLEALESLDSVNSHYGADTAKDMVIYFLSNATSWRGDTARRVKAELKGLIK
jgi:hypothetical protein